jgi:hypothetical protein
MYSKQEVLAFQRVGEFLCWFSMLETNLDETVINLLGLEPIAGRLLLTYVPFGKKCDFLNELIGLGEVGLSAEEKAQAKDKLGSIEKLADTRNVIAHSFFAAQEGGVKFLKAEKKMKADTSRTIDEESFQRHRTDIAELWGWVAQISHRIKMKMSKKQIAQALANRLANEISEPFSKPH